ncbi:MAG TPA: glycosyltransferase [Planctomycetaceae bacterium]|nr:glycosyltransferase [Planctomycetaceae bacterium]
MFHGRNLRIAIVHASWAEDLVAERVYNSLCHIWPEADLFLLERPGSLGRSLHESSEPAPKAASGSEFNPAGHPRRRIVRWSHLDPRAELELHGYDLLISTSPPAACQIAAETALHLCYLTPCSNPRTISDAHIPHGERIDSLLHYRQWNDRSVVHRAHEGGEPILSLRSVTHFIASSYASRDRHRPILGTACPVIHPPVDTLHFRPGDEAREAFYLLVCRGLPPAGVELAIEAIETAGRELVIVGWKGDGMADLPAHNHVRLVEAASDAALRDYYRRCRALIVPVASDFDLASVEAQACGTPVIALHGGGAAEIILDSESGGPGTGVFFHEPTVASLVSALKEVERRPHKCSAALGWAQATKFSTAHFEHALRTFATHLCEATRATRELESQRRRAA